MSNKLSGRVALITGSSSGLGRAIALLYSKEGAKVICTDLDENARPDSHGETPAPTHDLINIQGGNAMFKRVDVLKEKDVEDAITFAVEVYGRLDIMVNNAGTCPEVYKIATNPGGLRVHESSTEDFDRTLAVNTRGTYLGCKYATRQFMNQDPCPENSRGERTRGWIVNVASAAGLVALPGAPAYVTSKHAVMGLTKEVAVSYATDRIHCNALCPSFIPTALIADLMDHPENPVAAGTKDSLIADHPWKSLGTPEDVAKSAVFLASEDAQWITGTGLVIDGGYTAK